MNYCQCQLKKGNVKTTSWLPEEYSKTGKFLMLKHDDGWEVISVGQPVDYREVNDRSQDYKRTRIASDI